MTDPRDPRVPATGLVFGDGAMVPLVVAALAAWRLPPGRPMAAVQLAMMWAALVLAFADGVRRGFGLAADAAGRRRAGGAMEAANDLRRGR